MKKSKKSKKEKPEVVDKPTRRRRLPKPQKDPQEKLFDEKHHRFKPEQFDGEY